MDATSFPTLLAYAAWSFDSFVFLFILKNTSSAVDVTTYKPDTAREKDARLRRKLSAFTSGADISGGRTNLDVDRCIIPRRRWFFFRLSLGLVDVGHDTGVISGVWRV
jgi:hypothetical protein